ncbi:MAG: gamma-glutamylcyclotransferase [Candidatus Micrarchaeota archaeon]|nr:gamma-glutamylcyclotransferase [Candidatus Micrarchaeota archaeon]
MLYFAYGSNMNLSQLRRRLNRDSIDPLVRAYLPDTRLIFPRISHSDWRGGVAGFEEAKGEKLWGAVFELHEREFLLLDEYEGYYGKNKENDYDRIQAVAVKDNGEKVKVTTYIANKMGEFDPSDYYLAAIVKGAELCGLPDEYIKWLKSIKTNGIKKPD